MKKNFLIFIIVLIEISLSGYLCYVVFADKNIKQVEIQGEYKQIYFLGEEFEIENVKLRVTYYSGRVETISANQNNVLVRYFDSNSVGEKEGSLFYKTHEAKVNYYVIRSGDYINSSQTKIFKFNVDGTFNYYEKENGIWTIRDSEFDSTLVYNFDGNKIIFPETFKSKSFNNDFSTGENEHYFSLKVNSGVLCLLAGESGMSFSNTNITDSFGLPISAEFDNENQPFVCVPYQNNIAIFEIDSVIGECGLAVKVRYSKGEDFYVFLGDKMFIGLDLTEEVLNTTRATGCYKNLCEIVLFYQVVNLI